MSVWSKDREYGLLAMAAEQLAKEAAAKLSKDQSKGAGRGVQAMMSDPVDNYRDALIEVPKLINDAPSRELAGMDIIRLLANREKTLTNSQSTAPGMEFHHLTHNNALYDATKYFPLSTHALIHDGYQQAGFKAGVAPEAGVVISRYGHRLAPNSAHRNPETGGNYTQYFGTQPVDIDPNIVLKDEEAFAQEYLRTFIDQKAMPMYKYGMEIYDKEAPLRQFLDSVAGGPVESFKSPAVYKNAIREAGIEDSDTMRIARNIHGIQAIRPTGKTTINTSSWRQNQRPGGLNAVDTVSGW